jgi:hypothetical protein
MKGLAGDSNLNDGSGGIGIAAAVLTFSTSILCISIYNIYLWKDASNYA